MKIALVGAGNVASSLGVLLADAGYTIASVFSRTIENAAVLAEKVGAVAVDSLSEIPQSDVYLVMLSDDALLGLAPDIVRSCPDAVFVHTSGSVPMSVWTDAGAGRCGVFYPMQSFTKGKIPERDRLPLFLEASDSATMALLHAMASAISTSVTEFDSCQRGRLHLAAVFATNFANRMMTISEHILKDVGLPFDIMAPLLKEMVDKALVLSPGRSQTGPAARGDRRVMDMHEELLATKPEWLELYRLISADILKGRNDYDNKR